MTEHDDALDHIPPRLVDRMETVELPPKARVVIADSHSGHNLPIGAHVTFLERRDGAAFYTQGGDGDEVAIDERDLEPQLPAQGLKEPWCAYAQDGMVDDDGDHFVAYIEGDRPGYYTTTYTGDLEYCRAVAASINEDRGIDERRMMDIVSSSFAAASREGLL